MANAYKKFTANDIATVPFNAHKLYNFTSASAVLNKVTYFNANWTSESIDLYSSGSVKYNQIDHLFYKNNKKNLGYNFGEQHYAKQRRVLYENLNIISVPNGLIGYEIKPNSLFISTNKGEFIEDTHGNLIVSGTNLSDYSTDIESNILNIGPVNGFERYNLNILSGYAITLDNDLKAYYRNGKLTRRKKAFMKMHYLTAVRNELISFNQELYDYLGKR